MKKHKKFQDSKSTTSLNIMVLSNSKGSMLDKNKKFKNTLSQMILIAYFWV